MNHAIKIFILGLMCFGLCSCKTTDYAMIAQSYSPTHQVSRAVVEAETPLDTDHGDTVKILLLIVLFFLLFRQLHLSNFWGRAKKSLQGKKAATVSRKKTSKKKK